MITRKMKEQIVAGLVEKFSKASGFYVVNFSGMSVKETNDFRQQVRDKEFEYYVAKNTLILLALEQVEKFSVPKELLFGQSGIIFSYDDPTAPSKLIKDFSKKTERPALKVANLEGEVFDGSRLDEITKLPTKPELIAGIIGSLNAPITGITRSLNQASGVIGAMGAVTRDLIHVIDAAVKKKHAA